MQNGPPSHNAFVGQSVMLDRHAPRFVLLLAGALLLGFASSCGSSDNTDVSTQSPDDVGEEPPGTETNFFVLPCRTDADCAEGESCNVPEPSRDEGDAGAGLGRCRPVE
jgi:hypothetical protein